MPLPPPRQSTAADSYLTVFITSPRCPLDDLHIKSLAAVALKLQLPRSSCPSKMFRFASDLTASLDDLQAQVTLVLQTDPSSAAISASGAILERMHRAKSLCQSICDLTLKESPLAAMSSPKRSKGVHAVVKAAYLPAPPRPEDDQVKMPGPYVEPQASYKFWSRSGRRRP